MESAGYATAKKIDTEEGYETFLTRFPWGVHSAEADGRRAVLAAPPGVVAHGAGGFEKRVALKVAARPRRHVCSSAHSASTRRMLPRARR